MHLYLGNWQRCWNGIIVAFVPLLDCNLHNSENYRRRSLDHLVCPFFSRWVRRWLRYREGEGGRGKKQPTEGALKYIFFEEHVRHQVRFSIIVVSSSCRTDISQPCKLETQQAANHADPGNMETRYETNTKFLLLQYFSALFIEYLDF